MDIVKEPHRTVVLGRLLRRILEEFLASDDAASDVECCKNVVKEFERRVSDAHWLVNESGTIWALNFRPGWPNEHPEGTA